MYYATLIIDDLTVWVWSETANLSDNCRIHISGDIKAENFNPDFYEQIKTAFTEKAQFVPF
jgi:hypothetical protein